MEKASSGWHRRYILQLQILQGHQYLTSLQIEDATDIETEIDEILEEFGQKFPSFPVIHTIAYF